MRNELSFHFFIKEKKFLMAKFSSINSCVNGGINTAIVNPEGKETGLGEKSMRLFLVMLSLETETFKM